MFACLVGGSQVLGLASVVLTGVWMGHYRGGFAWDGSGLEFNLHPLCMVLGLVFLQGDGQSTHTHPQAHIHFHFDNAKNQSFFSSFSQFCDFIFLEMFWKIKTHAFLQ